MKKFEEKETTVTVKKEENKEVISKQEIEKEDDEEDEDRRTTCGLIITFIVGMFIGFALTLPFNINIYKDVFKIANKEVLEEHQEEVIEEKDLYNNYADGARGMQKMVSLKNDVIIFYKKDYITDEEMKKYTNSYMNIISLALSDSDIPPEEIENYNSIINDIYLINYNQYKIQSTGEDYMRGFKNFIIANSCWQIVDYYQEIPETKKAAFKIVVEQNLSYEEEGLRKVIDYGKNLIKEYIGDPNKILSSTDWRVFTGMPEK